jgi:hypothetical protein
MGTFVIISFEYLPPTEEELEVDMLKCSDIYIVVGNVILYIFITAYQHASSCRSRHCYSIASNPVGVTATSRLLWVDDRSAKS